MVNMAGGVMENAGLCLDRFGVPYVPGSAVKGCARRMAIQNLLEAREAKESSEKLVRLLTDSALVFGWGEQDWKTDRDTKGHFRSDFVYAIGEDQWPETAAVVGLQLLGRKPASAKDFGHFAGATAFLPAYPYQLPFNDVELDVVTCHHPDYYSQRKDRAGKLAMPVALDTEEPNPVVFPAVAAGAVFAFAVLPLRGERGSLAQPPKKLHEIAREQLRQGLEAFGLGAKTSAGYGWFKEIQAPGGTTASSPQAAGAAATTSPPQPSPTPSAPAEHPVIAQWRGRTQPANFRAFRPLLAAIQDAGELRRVFNAIMPSNEQQPRTLRNPYWQSFRSHPEGAAILQRLQITLR
jgi:CRISPR-associated protein Cmr6